MVLRRSCAATVSSHSPTEAPEGTYLRIAKPPKRNPIVRPTIPPIVAPILTGDEEVRRAEAG